MDPVVTEMYDLRDQLVGAGLERLAFVRGAVGAVPGGTDRTYAACAEDGLTIVLSPDLGALEPDIVRGILMHELGHAADFLYPAQIALATGGCDLVVYEEEPRVGKMRAWKRRESVAKIAELRRLVQP